MGLVASLSHEAMLYFDHLREEGLNKGIIMEATFVGFPGMGTDIVRS